VRNFKTAKVVFYMSAAALLMLYGYASSILGLPPGPLIDKAMQQVALYVAEPDFVNDRAFDRQGVTVLDGARVAPGPTLIASHFERWDWSTGLVLIDQEGSILHEWPLEARLVFERLAEHRDRPDIGNVHGSYLFENGDILVNVSYTGVLRADACGKVVWSLPNFAHHSISRDDEGYFWIPTTTVAEVPKSPLFPDGYPGLDRPVNHDRVVRISEHGVTVASISMLDVLFQNGLARFLFKSRPDFPPDLMHVNDVEPLPESLAAEYPLFDAGDLLVSMRSSDLVLVVDPVTRKVLWHISEPLVHQHDPDFIGGGWIGVFDNASDGTERGGSLGGSRILAFQPHTGRQEELYVPSPSGTFYTEKLGKWQLLDNGNLLLTEGQAGRLIEVSPEGRTVWEWIQEPYDGSKAVEVTEGTRYHLTREQIAAWDCTPEAE
jgi:hypothetical protein